MEEIYFFTQRYMVPYEHLPRKMRQGGVGPLETFIQELGRENAIPYSTIFRALDVLAKPAAVTVGVRFDLERRRILYALAICSPGDVFSRREGRALIESRLSAQAVAKTQIQVCQDIKLGEKDTALWQVLLMLGNTKNLRQALRGIFAEILYYRIFTLEGCPDWLRHAKRQVRKPSRASSCELEA